MLFTWCGGAFATTPSDSIPLHQKKSFFKKVWNGIEGIVNEFNTYDTAYIEPQHFKFQAMGQMATRFEGYTLNTREGQEITLAPETSTTFGPYAGYSLIFLGYTLQLNNLYIGNAKKTFNLSLYTSLLGADFYYRDNRDFRIRDISVDNVSTKALSPLVGTDFDGFHVKYWGFNTYYIPNHRKHSYPAAYNQSTCQKISSGSALFGIGYRNYAIDMDWMQLDNAIHQQVPDYDPQISEEQKLNNITYHCYSIFGGYSYNWVFAKNWLAGASGSLALSYNKSNGETFRAYRFYEDFKLNNLSIDGIGRFGIVWNNTRLFAGASAQIHSYRYRKDQFSIGNYFGCLNAYFGINFGKKKPYRKQGKFFEF